MATKNASPIGLHEAEADGLLTLAQAARLLPIRNGKAIHPSTVWRWATVGVRGVRLEVRQVGGTKCTTPRLLNEFFHALGNKLTPLPDREAARKRAHRADGKYLRTKAGA